MKNTKQTSKHTGGEWYANGVHVQTMAEYDNYICQVEGDNQAQAEANARLIASAPLMLEALEEIAGTKEWTGEAKFLTVQNIARVAIKKAKGE